MARGSYYVILPILPELRDEEEHVTTLTKEYSSGDHVLSVAQTRDLLADHRLLDPLQFSLEGELLR